MKSKRLIIVIALILITTTLASCANMENKKLFEEASKLYDKGSYGAAYSKINTIDPQNSEQEKIKSRIEILVIDLKIKDDISTYKESINASTKGYTDLIKKVKLVKEDRQEIIENIDKIKDKEIIEIAEERLRVMEDNLSNYLNIDKDIYNALMTANSDERELILKPIYEGDFKLVDDDYELTQKKKKPKDYYSPYFPSATYNNTDLDVEFIDFVYNDPIMQVTGVVKNNDSISYSFIEIKATFYDENSNIVHIGSTYATGSLALRPGESKQFELIEPYISNAASVTLSLEDYNIE